MRRHLNPSTLSPPGNAGVAGYSQVVEVRGGERTIYVSGQVAVDKDGKVVGEGDFEAQTRQLFENLKAALPAVDALVDHVVKITVFVTDSSRLQRFREIRNTYFSTSPPASSLIQVVRLAAPEWLVEVEAIAVVGEDSDAA